MSPRTVMITGANRGIGLELVKQFLLSKPAPAHLFATCRDPAKATDLQDLADKNSNLHILTLDVTDRASFPRIAKEVGAKVEDQGLNLLINNAAFYPDNRDARNDTTAELMMKGYETNCVAPLFLSKALLPLVKMAADKNAEAAVGVNRAAIVMMSTAVASIAENSGGGAYAYR